MDISELLRQPAPLAAPALIGWTLVHKTAQGAIGGIIVETEAYTREDPASHAFSGQTLRNSPMFQPAGTIYVYFTYGMHYCLNIVTGNSNGEAVLIRALEPIIGTDLMQINRKMDTIKNLCSGPAKLVQALAIEPEQNASHLNNSQLLLLASEHARKIGQGPRIGIKKAIDQPWRFFDIDSPYLSRKH